jgi:hypothetical protein
MKTFVTPYIVVGLSGTLFGTPVFKVSGPKTAIVEGIKILKFKIQDYLELYCLAMSRAFITPSPFTFIARFGFFSPAADKIPERCTI